MPNGTATTVRPLSKSELVQELSDQTGQPKASVKATLAALETVIQKEMGRRGRGVFVLPGLLKVSRVKKPATKARKGINPFTKQETVFKARPARTVAKVRPLKKLREFVA